GVCWSRSSLPPGCVPSLGGATGACGTASTPASPWPAPTSDPGARLGRRPGLAGPAGSLRPLALTVAKVQCAQGGGSRPHGAVCVCVGVLVLALLGSVAAAEPGHGGAVANQQPAARGAERGRAPHLLVRGPALCCSMFGGVLLSHTLSGAVPSALEAVTTGFGMGPGVTL